MKPTQIVAKAPRGLFRVISTEKGRDAESYYDGDFSSFDAAKVKATEVKDAYLVIEIFDDKGKALFTDRNRM